MQKSTQKKEYDMAMKNKAITTLVLRVAVAGYIGYLGWKLLSNMFTGAGTLPVWVVWSVCIVFAAVALGFCVFAWKGFQKGLKAAEISSADGTKRNDDAQKNNEISDSEDV